MEHSSASAPSNGPPKRVVIVDDSRTMRHWLRLILERDSRLQVVGEAQNADEARSIIKQTRPDVLTLDVEMPGMNGLTFLERLMRLRPMPVVMISGITRSNSQASITALSLGAVDCILKPGSRISDQAAKDIARRVYSAARSTVQTRLTPNPFAPATDRAAPLSELPLILLGASTGGVAALETVLSQLNPNGPPVVIVQHMPAAFLHSFAELLNNTLDQDVALAKAGVPLGPGQIRLAPAEGAHTEVRRRAGIWTCQYESEPRTALHCPSVDALFHSAAPWAPDVIAGILTGLGRDGASGITALRQAGAATIGQDEASSVVYGMPRAAWDMGGITRQLPVGQIGAAINAEVARHAATARRRHS